MNKDVKVRVVKTKVMADALVWVGGFEYKKDEEGNFIFERTKDFDRAFKDLHYIRSLHIRNKK